MKKIPSNKKSKNFLKSIGILFTSFIAGISASVFYFLRIFGHSGNRNANFRDELDQLVNGLGSKEAELSGLADNNEQARELTAEQRETLTDIGNRHTGIEDTSKEIGNSIQRIKQIIREERVESIENKD